MPELPEMQALAERLDSIVTGQVVSKIDPLDFSGLRTVTPPPDAFVGRRIEGVGRRGKYLVITFAGGQRMLVHLAQAGRLDIEHPAKATRPRGAIVRVHFGSGDAILVREHGHERSARWWLLAPGDDGPIAALGPDVGDPAFESLILASEDHRRIHTILRDQHFAAGVGRGYADDALNLAGISPFASLRSLDEQSRRRLIEAVRTTLAAALEGERGREGGLSAARLGDRFTIHKRAGEPCPRCGDVLLRVSYASHEVVYCKTCQTGGKIFADRRLSRLLR